MSEDCLTSVMLVDDHEVVRELLRESLERTGEFRVVGEASDGAQAVALAPGLAPDLIVMDLLMPVKDGVEACREILELLPSTRVIMLTALGEEDAVVRSVAAGARGYLPKYSSKAQLLTVLREVVQGEFRIPGDAAGRLARAVRPPSDEVSRLLGSLTDREREMLLAFAGGMTYKQIGGMRGISALTVRNAMSAVQRKLGFGTRQQMVLWAVRNGLVEGDLSG